MAAAALLRSMARKIARPQPPHLGPLLVRGLQGVANSGCHSSLSPPTSNEVCTYLRHLQSGSLATKMARAPPPPHHRLLHQRGLHTGPSGSTPLSTIDDLRMRLAFARAAAGIGAITITGSLIYLYFRVLPELEPRSKRLANNMQQSANEDQIMQSSEHGRQPNTATGKGTTVDKSKEDLAAEALSIVKELDDGIKNFESHLKELDDVIKGRHADLEAEISRLKAALDSARSK